MMKAVTRQTAGHAIWNGNYTG